MLIFIEFGNIFEISGVLSYAHGCNCAGAMGRGIALQFKKKYPRMFKEYKTLCETTQFQLGDVFEYNYGEGYVFNLATQATWKSKADINAIEKSFKTMFILANEKRIRSIAIPKIGCGLGRLNWQSVRPIIENNAEIYPQIDIFVVENYKE